MVHPILTMKRLNKAAKAPIGWLGFLPGVINSTRDLRTWLSLGGSYRNSPNSKRVLGRSQGKKKRCPPLVAIRFFSRWLMWCLSQEWLKRCLILLNRHFQTPTWQGEQMILLFGGIRTKYFSQGMTWTKRIALVWNDARLPI